MIHLKIDQINIKKVLLKWLRIKSDENVEKQIPYSLVE